MKIDQKVDLFSELESDEKLISRFIKNNLEVDDVLDKINELGSSSLNILYICYMKNVRFIKIVTSHTNPQLESMILSSGLSEMEVENIEKVYNKFQFIEYLDSSENICMFVCIHRNHIIELFDLYLKLNMSFKYEDVTTSALFGVLKSQYKIELEGKSIDYASNNFPLIDKFIDDFVDNNLEVDDVLDKINEFGKDSLNEKDFLVLKSF